MGGVAEQGHPSPLGLVRGLWVTPLVEVGGVNHLPGGGRHQLREEVGPARQPRGQVILDPPNSPLPGPVAGDLRLGPLHVRGPRKRAGPEGVQGGHKAPRLGSVAQVPDQGPCLGLFDAGLGDGIGKGRTGLHLRPPPPGLDPRPRQRLASNGRPHRRVHPVTPEHRAAPHAVTPFQLHRGPTFILGDPGHGAPVPHLAGHSGTEGLD
mmetsp:Transcript_25403/g.65345  ORF Transcript_25403/g.65345 Transcript_25403/m.65345 type:complete len:208 (+) Transcript_25403:344-967(+)